MRDERIFTVGTQQVQGWHAAQRVADDLLRRMYNDPAIEYRDTDPVSDDILVSDMERAMSNLQAAVDGE